jgi:hypothetical protein
MNLQIPEKVAVKLTKVDRISNRESSYVEVGEALDGYCYRLPTTGQSFKFIQSFAPTATVPKLVVTTPVIDSFKVSDRRYQFTTKNSIYEVVIG